MTDIEIARSITPKKIAKLLKIEEYIEQYGKYKVKISLDVSNNNHARTSKSINFKKN